VRVSDAVTRKVYEGSITGIDPKIDPATRLISVRAEISTTDRALQPGQFVRVAVILPAEENVIALPQTAVVTSLYGDYVFAVVEAPPPAEGTQPAPAATNEAGAAEPAAKPLEAKQIFVKIGRRSGGFIEIPEGVATGQQIVTAGQNRLTNGTPVTVDNTVDPVAAVRPEDTGP
jgi:membrane fusion protein (multidrug efflux system)